jgi:hypothetical protein
MPATFSNAHQIDQLRMIRIAFSLRLIKMRMGAGSSSSMTKSPLQHRPDDQEDEQQPERW